MKAKQIFFVIFIFTSAFLSCHKEKKETVNNKTEKSVINVPISELNIGYTIYPLDPQKDTVLIYKTGSRINIPKDAFLDSKGNIVTGKVNLKYREFSNALDIYLAGIPMRYDSAGNNMVFETAGMLEIEASSNNKPVYVNPNSKITVNMNSFETGGKYNLYQLDTVSGKWKNIGKDKVETENYNKELANLPEIPPEPRKATGFTFSISDGTGKYPELAMYKNVLFEPVDGKKCGFEGTTQIKLKKLKNGKYEVTFIAEYKGILLKKEKCICYPVFKEGVEYDKALKIYQKKYRKLLAKRAEKRKALDLEWDNYHKALKKYEIEFFNKNSIYNLNTEDKVLRTLQINNFGFINCDCPTSYPQGAELVAVFRNKDGNKLQLKDVVLVEKEKNTLFRYKNIIKFNPKVENILWGITNKGKLAYFKSDDFKKIDKTSGDYTFKMNIYNGKIKSYDEIVNTLFGK